MPLYARLSFALIALCGGLGGAAAQSLRPRAATTTFDLVVLNGRVMDPESNLDAIRHLGIADGRLVAISARPLVGRDTIDATGLVVAPGFIDLHQHSFSRDALYSKVRDGVTSALEMELGISNADRWYASLADVSPIHFGATVGHASIRMQVLTSTDAEIPAGEGATRAATEAEIVEIRRRIDHELRQGALGIGLAVAYTPGASPWELLEMFRTAAAFPGAPVHVHVRSTEEPQYWMETAELILGAVVSGAPLHIVHANSSFGSDAPKLFAMIEAARARGLDVTTETYPYTVSMTRIETPPFDDWESWPDERFSRYTWPETGERLTRESFGRYRQMGGVILVEGMSEDHLLPTLSSPLPIIASDGVMEAEGAHPRASGTYARILGHFVRERGVLSLMDALRKMTLMPAQRLEARVPSMRQKGRIRVGADADLTLFDPATVRDQATYREPTLPSAGIPHVIVAGVPVVRNGQLHTDALPGQAIRAPRR